MSKPRIVAPRGAKKPKHLAKEALQVLIATGSLRQWRHRCHEASLYLVQNGVGDRVARGFHPSVRGQHSWAVVGWDCYDEEALIIDATLWSYTDGAPAVIVTQRGDAWKPHGEGSIWEWGKPRAGPGPAVALTPNQPLSELARHFLEMVGPLDRQGWQVLASNAPVQGWPAAEILAAIEDTESLQCLVPIDRIGMLTRRNPGGLYLRSRDTVC